MEPIPLKIKKGNNQANPESKNILNLSQTPENALALKGPLVKRLKKLIRRRWLILLLIFALASQTVWLTLVVFTQPTLPHLKVIPPTSPTIIYLNQASLRPLLADLQTSQYAWPPFQWFSNLFQQFTTNNNLTSESRLLPAFFKDPLTLVLLPTDSIAPHWLLLADLDFSPDNFALALKQGEEKLKQNYDLVFESYRQIKITQIKPLNQDSHRIFYASVGKTFLLANNLTSLKKTIDQLLQ